MKGTKNDRADTTREIILSHILDHIPYKSLPREKVKFPKRRKPGGDEEPKRKPDLVEERF